ncbi:unnamed protein product, partial [Mesorhabditis spiculigera]
MDETGGIGKDGQIPWHSRKDFQFFVENTTRTSNPEECGDNGPQMLGIYTVTISPIKGIVISVLSRTMEPVDDGELIVSGDLEEVLSKLTEMQQRNEIETIWNIGGRDLYGWALENGIAERLVVTHISGCFDANIKMPPIAWDDYEEDCSLRSDEQTDGPLKFVWRVYNHK